MRIQKKLIEKVALVLKKYNAKKAAIFGSCARGDAKRNCDLDILVELPGELSLLDFVGVKQEIEKAVGKKVDLVEYDMIKPSVRKRVLAEQIAIL